MIKRKIQFGTNGSTNIGQSVLSVPKDLGEGGPYSLMASLNSNTVEWLNEFNSRFISGNELYIRGRSDGNRMVPFNMDVSIIHNNDYFDSALSCSQTGQKSLRAAMNVPKNSSLYKKYHGSIIIFNGEFSDNICILKENTANNSIQPTAVQIQSSNMTACGWLYALQDRTNKNIKFGYSSLNPQNRVAGLQTGNSSKIDFLGAMPGYKKDEQELHSKFMSYNTLAQLGGGTEWFYPVKDVLSYIHQNMRK